MKHYFRAEQLLRARLTCLKLLVELSWKLIYRVRLHRAAVVRVHRVRVVAQVLRLCQVPVAVPVVAQAHRQAVLVPVRVALHRVVRCPVALHPVPAVHCRAQVAVPVVLHSLTY
jgi:hypothetical protein